MTALVAWLYIMPLIVMCTEGDMSRGPLIRFIVAVLWPVLIPAMILSWGFERK